MGCLPHGEMPSPCVVWPHTVEVKRSNTLNSNQFEPCYGESKNTMLTLSSHWQTWMANLQSVTTLLTIARQDRDLADLWVDRLQVMTEKNSSPFGTIISESGAGCTWAENSHEFRLTPWSNDPVQDTTGEAVYIRDEHTGQFWSTRHYPLAAP
jgi:uncharacterized protein YjiS (DUF1127 family)